jgi:hypothetical protein
MVMITIMVESFEDQVGGLVGYDCMAGRTVWQNIIVKAKKGEKRFAIST